MLPRPSALNSEFGRAPAEKGSEAAEPKRSAGLEPPRPEGPATRAPSAPHRRLLRRERQLARRSSSRARGRGQALRDPSRRDWFYRTLVVRKGPAGDWVPHVYHMKARGVEEAPEGATARTSTPSPDPSHVHVRESPFVSTHDLQR